MRLWRWMAGAAGACALAACGADQLTGVGRAAPIGASARDVAAGSGGVTVTLRYKGDTLGVGTTGCGSFTISVVDSASGQRVAGTNGTPICGTWTAPTVPAGAYRVRVSFAPYSPVVPGGYGPADLAATAVFHVDAGQTAPVTVEVGAAVGQVRGQVLIDGQPPSFASVQLTSAPTPPPGGQSWTYSDFAYASNVPQSGAPPGGFVRLLPAGQLTAAVYLSGQVGVQLGPRTGTIVAGQTTDLGNVTGGGGTVAVALRYKGDTLSEGTTGCGAFAISVVDTVTGQRAGANSGGSICGTLTVPAVPPGTYRVRVTYSPFGQPYPGQVVPADLLTSGAFTVATGQTARVELEVGGKVGQVRGRLLINGQPPTGFASVVLRSTPAGSPSTPYSDFADVRPYANAGVPAGEFVRLVPAGALTATAYLGAPSNAQVGPVTGTVAAGATTDLGNLAGAGGAVSLTVRYRGQALGASTTGCGSFVISVVDSATGQQVTGNNGAQLCDAWTAPAVPAGTYRVRLRYAPYASTAPNAFEPPDLATSSVFRVAANDTARVELEVASKVGQVKGRVLVNGQPPSFASVNLQSTTDPAAGAPGWRYYDNAYVYNTPLNGLPAGTYLRLLPAGRLTGTVSVSPSGDQLAISGVVEAGRLTVVGQPSVLSAAADVQPETISMSRTSTVTVYLLSDYYLDARQADAASARLRVVGGRGVAVAKRGGAPMTSVVDVNHDGLPDRMFVFLRSDLAAAGLSTARARVVLEDLTGSVRYTATDAAPPRVVK